MSSLPEDPTAPLELSRFGLDARALSEEDFAIRHGYAFLLHQGNLDPSRKPTRPQATMIMGRVLPSPETQPTGISKGEVFRGVGLLRLYPVRHTGRSPFPRIVTVGRTKNNDIVLADVGISKFHAFFKEEGGQFFLADGESRNGTFVEGERAFPTKQGKPTALTSGLRVKFGALEFRFVDAHELVVLARQFG
jgi:hypothetical protein